MCIRDRHHLADGKVIKVSDQLMQNGHSVGLRVDMTEFSKAKAAAEAASEAKSDFMGLLSHELRTPLTVILGVARLSANARLLGPSKELLAALETRDADPKELEVLANRMFDQLSGHDGPHDPIRRAFVASDQRNARHRQDRSRKSYDHPDRM